jgi:hypothetical protein
MEKVAWNVWNPGLDNDDMSLQSVRDTLPANNADDISLIVRIFENPKSPIAFKGAISLDRHDCVHILLGRGLLPQDEAFVLGYTMGTAPNISDIESLLFQFVTKYLYPDPYRLTENNLKAYKLGLEAAKSFAHPEVYHVPLEMYGDKTLAELRGELGIKTESLRTLYRAEQVMLPDTKESKRLPV